MRTNELPLVISYLTAAAGLVWLLQFIGTHYVWQTSPQQKRAPLSSRISPQAYRGLPSRQIAYEKAAKTTGKMTTDAIVA